MRYRTPGCTRLLLVPVSVAAAALTACVTTPPEDDPVQIKLNELDSRVARIERVVSNQSLVDLAQHLDSVQAEVRQLRGRLDELENSSEALKKQQRDLYSDLDKRLGSGGGAGAAGAVGAADSGAAAGSGPTAQPASSVEQSVYNQAFEALKAGSYSVAITGFKDFLSSYPASPLAENAQYWLGEAYYVNRDYDNASSAFRNVLQKWPNSRKGPDALLKLGYTQFELKRYGEARQTLQDVVQKYPDSDAARLASERLKRFPANAH
ncbi:MAG TPA: tol-pal system protein YbgF [Steroidobacteraceae bacterium]|nr:tol-pal system protein YbgF [Steroidobacteraceae bacterium]